MRQKGFALVIILVLIGLGVLVYFGIFYRSRTNQAASPTPISTSDSTASPTPSTTSSPTLAPSKLYLIKFKLKSTSNLPPVWDYSNAKYTLAEYLDGLFKLPDKSISHLVFDTRHPSPYNPSSGAFNIPFYAILGKSAKLNSSYSDEYLTANIEKVDDAILPYLIKPDYCEEDSDCSLRNNMCTYGAFNYYQNYQDPPWGCGPGGYKDNYNWFSWGERDEKLNCETELKFDGAKCEKNLCVETGYKKVCINTN